MSLSLSSGKCKKTAIQAREVDFRFRGNDDTGDAHPEACHSRESAAKAGERESTGQTRQCLRLQRRTRERTLPNFLALPGGANRARESACDKMSFCDAPVAGK